MTASRNSQAHIAPTAGGVPSSPSLALYPNMGASSRPCDAGTVNGKPWEAVPVPAVHDAWTPWAVKSKGWL